MFGLLGYASYTKICVSKTQLWISYNGTGSSRCSAQTVFVCVGYTARSFNIVRIFTDKSYGTVFFFCIEKYAHIIILPAQQLLWTEQELVGDNWLCQYQRWSEDNAKMTNAVRHSILCTFVATIGYLSGHYFSIVFLLPMLFDHTSALFTGWIALLGPSSGKVRDGFVSTLRLSLSLLFWCSLWTSPPSRDDIE